MAVVMNAQLKAPNLAQIRLAQSRLAGLAIRTPLIKLNYPGAASEIYLKLENLQPTGVFKVRCMGNKLRSLDAQELQQGIYTASSGNSGYAMAWLARQMGISARVYAPADAPEWKCQEIRRVGAEVILLPQEEWWEIICGNGKENESGLFLNAVGDETALAGNATIGLEIYEDLPHVHTIVVPFGGGGVACGIASAMEALKPDTRILGAECETATPLTAALQAGEPVRVNHQFSFISGIGSVSVLPYMWPLLQRLLHGSLIATLEEVKKALRILFENHHVVAEGAGATALAGALSLQCDQPLVCVITGGNIDRRELMNILEEGVENT